MKNIFSSEYSLPHFMKTKHLFLIFHSLRSVGCLDVDVADPICFLPVIFNCLGKKHQ